MNNDLEQNTLDLRKNTSSKQLIRKNSSSVNINMFQKPDPNLFIDNQFIQPNYITCEDPQGSNHVLDFLGQNSFKENIMTRNNTLKEGVKMSKNSSAKNLVPCLNLPISKNQTIHVNQMYKNQPTDSTRVDSKLVFNTKQNSVDSKYSQYTFKSHSISSSQINIFNA
jgi:hypothetical protein